MSYKLILYCKTFGRDFQRAKRLLESVKKHNKDNIPFFISAPSSEYKLLRNIIGTDGYEFVTDESIWQFQYRMDGWRSQQIVKSNVWKAVHTENYICIDSDQFFIKDFYVNDFIHSSGTIYSLVHENKEVQQYEKILFDKNYSENGYVKAVKAYRSVFGEQHNKIWDYGPPPYHWSVAVWKHFEENYLKPNNLTFETFQLAMQQEHNIAMREAVTYGEYLMAVKPIDIYPTAGVFKFYHWKEMYDFEQGNGLGLEENIKENYLGITLQSNWA